MTHLSEIVAQLVDEQQHNIASMRAMIERGSDSATLVEAVIRVDVTDVRIHSLAAVLMVSSTDTEVTKLCGSNEW